VWLGVFASVAIAGTGIGESIRLYFLDPFEFDPLCVCALCRFELLLVLIPVCSPQAILFGCFMLLNIVFAVIFIRNAKRFTEFSVLLAGSGTEQQPLIMKKAASQGSTVRTNP
jgi:hypothetical protein